MDEVPHETIERGSRRLVILKRPEGTFTCRFQVKMRSGEWSELGPVLGYYDSAETAKREARGRTWWLRGPDDDPEVIQIGRFKALSNEYFGVSIDCDDCAIKLVVDFEFRSVRREVRQIKLAAEGIADVDREELSQALLNAECHVLLSSEHLSLSPSDQLQDWVVRIALIEQESLVAILIAEDTYGELP